MKKAIITFTFLIFLLSGTNAQELEKVTEKKNSNKIITYHVLKDQTIKHGPVEIKYRGALGFHEKGAYNQGQKSGIWEYYDSKGDLVQKFNFSTYSFDFLKDFTSVKAVYILQNEELVEVNTGAMPEGPEEEGKMKKSF